MMSQSERWAMLNSEDKDDVLYTMKESGIYAEYYKAKFEKIKRRLNNKFFEALEKNNNFHDCEIKDIHIGYESGVFAEIVFAGRDKTICRVIFKNVAGYRLDMPDNDFFDDKMRCGYFEIFEAEDKLNVIITCEINCVFNIICGDIVVKEG